ncbi:hypothetical protein LTR10_016862 [Elasticomyces elasticus]|uniref:Uncharacterized protein n=1 Tax=Exophiala sideris TaxID=1016849 RepID=A0ABR0JK28_9EURO|nr:hypothetical protein LTR10_016862 [Elasticomyces elasticus]KAK5039281.1 hypothetical protein LTR13_003537 [Exophiala sideris]KAK5066292.1 hypothetical protein LTR69_002811 [Exophiala sideris]KAK5186969.1 hypothetical protein LTR44_000976 [Eurotiomycetes sp. CCFEE 6388]
MAAVMQRVTIFDTDLFPSIASYCLTPSTGGQRIFPTHSEAATNEFLDRRSYSEFRHNQLSHIQHWTQFEPSESFHPTNLPSMKFRGIEVCVISQFDICRLPEFHYPTPSQPADPFQVASNHEPLIASPFPTASCHVPIYPGSQIWFEYSIDSPHPPGAAYYFKLFINGKVITAWDCTAKHDFHGKMMYNLVNDGTDPLTGGLAVRRQALRFGDGLEDRHVGELDDDLIQINVYRIEHRRRIRDLEQGLGSVDVKSTTADGLRIQFDQQWGRRAWLPSKTTIRSVVALRFEKGLLIESAEYLEKHGIVPAAKSIRVTSSSSSIDSQETTSGTDQAYAQKTQHEGEEAAAAAAVASTTRSLVAKPANITPTNSPVRGGDKNTSQEKAMIRVVKSTSGSNSIRLADNDDSLSVKTKDSIEDLQSSVPRSPKSPRSPNKLVKKVEDETEDIEPELPVSPTRSPGRTRQRLKKKLTVNIDGADFDVERRKPALSPFTNGGVLRKAGPLTAPASVTEFGPTIEEEVRAAMKISGSVATVDNEKVTDRTTSVERGGKRLMGFLGRRTAGGKAV